MFPMVLGEFQPFFVDRGLVVTKRRRTRLKTQNAHISDGFSDSSKKSLFETGVFDKFHGFYKEKTHTACVKLKRQNRRGHAFESPNATQLSEPNRMTRPVFQQRLRFKERPTAFSQVSVFHWFCKGF